MDPQRAIFALSRCPRQTSVMAEVCPGANLAEGSPLILATMEIVSAGEMRATSCMKREWEQLVVGDG